MIVDCAIYSQGRRIGAKATVDEAVAAAHGSEGFVWIGLHEPSPEEFEQVTRSFELHPLAVEDAVHAHQRPKLELYDDNLFVVLKPARYVDSREVVDLTGQIMVFVGENFVVTVRHGVSTSLSDVRHALEAEPDRLSWGPASVLHAVADRVVDDYALVMRGLDNDIDQIEDEVFSSPSAAHAERIFKLKREILDFRRAVEPLRTPLTELARRYQVGRRTLRGVLPRRARPPHPGGRALERPRCPTRQRPLRQRRSGGDAPERGHAQDLRLGGHHRHADDDRRHLRDELSAHARARVGRTAIPLSLLFMVVVCFGLYRNFKSRNWL